MARKSGVNLRIPINGNAFEYVKNVDIEALGIHTLTDLWVLTRDNSSRDRDSIYLPATSERDMVKKRLVKLNIEELLHTFDENLSYINEQLGGHNIPPVFKELLDDLSRMRTVFQALADQDSSLADHNANEITMALMGSINKLHQAFGQINNRASLATAYESFLTAVDGDVVGLYSEWGEEIKNLLSIAKEFKTIEELVRSGLELLSGEHERWSKIIASHPFIQEAVQYFAAEAKFFQATLRYLAEQESVDVIRTIASDAEDHIGSLQLIQTEAQQIWQSANTYIQEDILPLEEKANALVARFKTTLTAISFYQSRLRQGLKPHEVPSATLSAAQYAEFEQLGMDQNWRKENIQPRIQQLFGRIQILLGNKPMLDETIAGICHGAERRLTLVRKKIEHELEEDEPTQVVSYSTTETAPDNSAPKPPVQSAKPFTPAIQTSTDARPALSNGRINELYELLMCAGLVLTCNTNHLAASYPWAMLEMLTYTGKVTTEEATAALEQLKALVNDNKLILANGDSVNTCWKKKKQHWISYELKGTPRWKMKLTQAAGVTARQLLKKHGLTEDVLKQTRQQRREVKEAAFRGKREAAQAAK